MTEPRPEEEIAREMRGRFGDCFYGTCGNVHEFISDCNRFMEEQIAAAIRVERQRAEAAERDMEPLLLAIKRRNERIDALEAALLNVIGSSFELNDARIGYVTLQVDRGDLGHARALLDTQQAP